MWVSARTVIIRFLPFSPIRAYSRLVKMKFLLALFLCATLAAARPSKKKVAEKSSELSEKSCLFPPCVGEGIPSVSPGDYGGEDAERDRHEDIDNAPRPVFTEGNAYNHFGFFVEYPEKYAQLLEDYDARLLRDQQRYVKIATDNDRDQLAELELLSDPNYLYSISPGYGVEQGYYPPPNWGPSQRLLNAPYDFFPVYSDYAPPSNFFPIVPLTPSFGSYGGSGFNGGGGFGFSSSGGGFSG